MKKSIIFIAILGLYFAIPKVTNAQYWSYDFSYSSSYGGYYDSYYYPTYYASYSYPSYYYGSYYPSYYGSYYSPSYIGGNYGYYNSGPHGFDGYRYNYPPGPSYGNYRDGHGWRGR